MSEIIIKPLEWEDIGSGFSRARAPLFGNIRVEKYGTRFTTCYSVPGYANTFAEGDFSTADEAKAACEAEYQKHIRAALDTSSHAQLQDETREIAGLRETLTNSISLLDQYFSTFGEMSGANQADIEDYRAVLSSPMTREGKPVVYVSGKQLPHNPEHAYIACRLQAEGNFDTPLFASSHAHLTEETRRQREEIAGLPTLPKLPRYSQSAFPHGFHELWTEKQMRDYARETAAFWRSDVVEKAAQIAERYGADPWIARDIRALASPVIASGEEKTAIADQIIGQIEALFPDWRAYRDLIDCIECTLHRLRAEGAHHG
jgi:hypothetical protein